MNKKIVSLFAVLALLFGCALANEEAASSITLGVFPSSSIWWIAVDPLGEANATVKLEMQESGSSDWTEMLGNPSWGYWQISSTDGNGFDLPLSFRLTSASGEQVTLSNVVSSISGGVISTDQQFGRGNNGGHHAAPTQKPTKAPKSTHAPATPKPTHAPATQAPTHAPATQAPTHAATHTQAPTHAAATKAPSHTQAPTHAAATQAPSHTQAPTKAASAPSGSSGSSSADLCAITPTSSEPLKILVPLYVDPGSEWDELITAAATGVPIIAIINPDNGPVSSGPDSSYTTYMAKFKTAGIEMLGYVHTLYGDRDISTVEADVNTYASLYPGLAGIFVDEVSADASELSYYESLYASISAHSGYVNTVINPGTQPDEGYLNAATNIVIFESPGTQLASQDFASWVNCAPSASEKAGYKYKFSGIAYNAAQSTLQSLLTDMQNIGMGFVFVTDGASGCCTYNNLASYFAAEAAAVLAMN